MTAPRDGTASRTGRALVAGARETIGLIVDDGALAVGVLLSVGLAALLAGPLRSSVIVGWVLFGLVWAAIVVSLRRARPRG